MDSLTILGGHGFVGGEYVNQYYHHAVGNIASVNDRNDLNVYSENVIHFISTVHNYNLLTDPHLDINTNLNLLVDVLENWRKRRDSKDGVFNFISSWFVYGGEDTRLDVREDDVCDPRGFYSITKHSAEQLLKSYCTVYGLRWRILRLANIIGPGDKKVSDMKNAIQYLADKIKSNRDVRVCEDGHFHRDFMHVKDCARAIDLVITKGNKNEIYNIGNGKTWDFLTVLDYVKQRTQSSSVIELIKSDVKTRSFYMNVDKLKSLGFKPEYTGTKLFNALIGDSE